MRSVPIDTYLTFGNGKKRPADQGKGNFKVFGSNGVIGHCDEFNNPAGTVTIGRVGSYCGSVHYSADKCWVTDNAIKGNAKTNADPRYCYYLLLTKDLHALRGGSGQPLINQTSVKSLEVPERDLVDQKAIAHILGTLDDKIELNQKMNQTLEEIAKAIFKSWFVDFDPVRAKAEGRPTGLSPEISDLFPDAMTDSEIGEIPKGWSQESIYHFCSVEYGAPFKSKLFNEDGQGIPLVRIRDLPKGKSDVFTEEIHPKGTLIKAGDLVVGMDGEFRCYLWRGTDSWMNQRVCKFVPRENVPSTFIWFALERPLHFIESTEVATTVIHLGKGDIDDFQFMRSSQELLDQFSKLTLPLLERMVIASKEIETLAELRDTLLPKLIAGELRIPDAEKLLEEAGI